MKEDQPDETHSRRLIIGIALIIASFVLGKLVFIPLIFRRDDFWQTATFIAYGITWVIFALGLWFAGREGYHIAMDRYRERRRKTLHAVRHHSTKAAERTYHIARHAAKLPVKGIEKGKEMIRRKIRQRPHG